ncbi:hypothetical protein ES702_02982 [subsurface metagenome]
MIERITKKITKEVIENIYSDNYKSEHSEFLRDNFSIAGRGIDTYNDYNISFEFKECFTNKVKNQWYKLPLYQVKTTDFFVFCLNNNEFHVIDSLFLSKIYKFPKGKSNIRIGKVRKISIFTTNNIEVLEKYIKNLKTK